MPKEETTPPAPKKDEGKTFDQADVDRIVQDRLAKEKAKVADYDELKAKAEELDKLKASSQSDLEKLTEQIDGLKKSQAETEQRALRAEVATAKGLTAAQAKRLAGSSREELEADADEIIEAFPVSSTESTPKGGPPSRQPKPALRGGGDPTEEPVETDPTKLAESVPRF